MIRVLLDAAKELRFGATVTALWAHIAQFSLLTSRAQPQFDGGLRCMPAVVFQCRV
jgi:hypothetical protein